MVGRGFFRAGHGDALILHCYRLAKYYSVDPDVFLAKPASMIRRHLVWTDRLIAAIENTQDE